MNVVTCLLVVYVFMLLANLHVLQLVSNQKQEFTDTATGLGLNVTAKRYPWVVSVKEYFKPRRCGPSYMSVLTGHAKQLLRTASETTSSQLFALYPFMDQMVPKLSAVSSQPWTSR